jgi:ABC-2 type transport system permease protein
MENLLATPVLPAEVMAGKILPYVVIGYVQLAVILLARACCSKCRWRQLLAAAGR